jgi:hypothetical protein
MVCVSLIFITFSRRMNQICPAGCQFPRSDHLTTKNHFERLGHEKVWEDIDVSWFPLYASIPNSFYSASRNAIPIWLGVKSMSNKAAVWARKGTMIKGNLQQTVTPWNKSGFEMFLHRLRQHVMTH